MTGQLISATEFGTYLGDETLNEDRANSILQQTQAGAEDVRREAGLDPTVPDSKFYVLYRVAERAYTAGRNQGRAYQYAASGVDDGGTPSAAGVYFTEGDRQDLLRGDSGQVDEVAAPSAFTIHTRSSAACVPDAWVPRPWGCW